MKKVLKINEEYYRAYLGLGLCFDKMGKYIYAVRFYKKYIAKKPHSQTAKSLVGRIYEIYKNKEKTDTKNLKIVKLRTTWYYILKSNIIQKYGF